MDTAEPAGPRPAPSRLVAPLIYAGGVVQGLALVTFPGIRSCMEQVKFDLCHC
jgi:hypothetical protein